VIVSAGPEAFRFLLRHQDDLFVDTPVLAIGVGRSSYQNQALPARFLAIPIAIEVQPTLEMALRPQPKAGEIVVVTGAANFDQAWEKRIRTALTEWQAHPPVRYLSGLPLEELLREVSHLSSNSIVYTPGMQRGGDGQAYANRDVALRMAEASSAPLYGAYSTMINFGIVGGYVFEMADVGVQAGQIVQRILAGEKLTQTDMPDALPSHYVVDWKQLERWHLSEANLPPGTVVVNRELGPWQKYKNYILGAVLLLALQSSLFSTCSWSRGEGGLRRSRSQSACGLKPWLRKSRPSLPISRKAKPIRRFFAACRAYGNFSDPVLPASGRHQMQEATSVAPTCGRSMQAVEPTLSLLTIFRGRYAGCRMAKVCSSLAMMN
jgi:hypothetical protein